MGTAVATKERPIIFSAPMVRAVLDGRKTMTRRVVKPQPTSVKHPHGECFHWGREDRHIIPNGPRSAHGGPAVTITELIGDYCPYGVPGERLWVREAWQALHVFVDPWTGYSDDFEAADAIPKDNDKAWWATVYAATDDRADEHKDDRGFTWRPAIHMPRWASRLLLEVVDVRVERLQELTVADAYAEGIPPTYGEALTVFSHADLKGRESHFWDNCTSVENFAWGWDALNSKRGFGWDANPWVWVVSFRRIDQ